MHLYDVIVFFTIVGGGVPMFSLYWFTLYCAIAIAVTFLEYILHHFGYHNRLIIAVKQVVEVPYTLVHEFSHAIVALITSGRIKKMTLHHNLSGSVVSTSSKKFSRIVTTLAGYTLPCYISFLFIWLLHFNAAFALYGYLIIAVFSFVFIRNMYGFFWLLGFISLLTVTLLYTPAWFILHISYFFVALLFIAALYGGYRILLLAWNEPRLYHDAHVLATETKIPAQVWGIVFFVHNIVISGSILYYFIL